MFTSVGLAGLIKEKLEGLVAQLPHLQPGDLPRRQQFQAIRVSQRFGVMHQCGERIASGDYEFRNRVYCPSLGKWLSNDPLVFNTGDPGSFRAYKNNPTQSLIPVGFGH